MLFVFILCDLLENESLRESVVRKTRVTQYLPFSYRDLISFRINEYNPIIATISAKIIYTKMLML